MNTQLLGAVLAGGAGVRFGGDKAEATVGGLTMLERAVTTARRVLAHVVVVGREMDARAGVDGIPDLRPGEGPMAGLEAALARARREGFDGVVLLGCDLPLLTAEALDRVVGAWRADDSVVAAGRAGAGAIEPLCAVYSVALARMVSERLDAGERSLHALFDAAGGRMLDLSTLAAAGAFTNVNTPGDHRRARARLASDPESGP